jgi:hypothetical protein
MPRIGKHLDPGARCVGDELGKGDPFVLVRLIRFLIRHIHGSPIHLQQVRKTDIALLLGRLVVDIQNRVRRFRVIVLCGISDVPLPERTARSQSDQDHNSS